MDHDPSTLPVATAGFFYVAETTQQAQKEVLSTYQFRNGIHQWPRLFKTWICARGADNRDVLNVGSPQQIIEKILYQHELFGHQRYIAKWILVECHLIN